MLKDKTEYLWLSKYTQELQKVKNKLASPQASASFDETKQITIHTDASKNGLGCCMLQEGRPVYFASRSLTPTEQNYAQIEIEFLGIIFAVNKFHHFIYGRNTKVLTDHKPLVSIMKKNLADIASTRLQRLKFKLLKYDLVVDYMPGKYLYVTDALSRAF